ncbi:hypothetical protein PCH_Pc22g20090 [Penicillium rubens Wisconsin 54-1255]|uniref:Uncharacterized protein n=1 Tax=Penicillium rubens (strain ATCC 28089 / DSM 1075 / NRRL 1951 / Wisconsin 54-1255) TaxID=500485 RepID=B6HQF1_PENRW|nr:hypothetical protein PCH_Pc22g20090 [Penicillium rubens Wisconsin 54-1255]
MSTLYHLRSLVYELILPNSHFSVPTTYAWNVTIISRATMYMYNRCRLRARSNQKRQRTKHLTAREKPNFLFGFLSCPFSIPFPKGVRPLNITPDITGMFQESPWNCIKGCFDS